jgi:hypothetical protein
MRRAALTFAFAALVAANDARAGEVAPAAPPQDASRASNAQAPTPIALGNPPPEPGPKLCTQLDAAKGCELPAPPKDEVKTAPLPWLEYVSLGGDAALIARPISQTADGATGMRLRPTLGFGVHGRVNIFKYLGFTGYFVDARHSLLLPTGALGVNSVVTQDGKSVQTYVFGARLSPTLPIGSRGKVWVTGGVGWGHLDYPRMTAADSIANSEFTIRERRDSFGEAPFGAGASIDLIPRWLRLEIEATGSFAFGQQGSATQHAQAIDAAGRKRDIGALPRLGATFVQTLGLSLIL